MMRSALLVLSLAACAPSPPAAEFPEGVDPVWFTLSPNGSGAAWAYRRGSDAFLMHDGRRQGPFP
jgi:hypothetical protein